METGSFGNQEREAMSGKQGVEEQETKKQETKEPETKEPEAKEPETKEPEAKEQRCAGGCHEKATPRQEKELKQLKNRLNRIVGQLNGISRMLDENRYCGDILIQLAAAESALQSFGYVILKEHMETCVVEEIRRGNVSVVDEAVELMRKLK